MPRTGWRWNKDLDLINPNWLMRHWETMGWSQGEKGLVRLEARRMDWIRGLAITEHTFTDGGGRRSTLTTHLRLIPPHEILEWLRRAGLAARTLFGDLRDGPYGLDSRRLVVVAAKD